MAHADKQTIDLERTLSTMARVQKVDQSMFPQVHKLLLEYNNEQLTMEDWRKLFNYPWETEEDYAGYVLMDGEDVVGFFSMIFSKRMINGRVERICNLPNWIVRKEYRDQSLALVLPALKLKDYTFTDFTPSREVYTIFRRLGFQEMDSRLKVLVPMPLLPRSKPCDQEILITTDLAIIEQSLQSENLQIFRDHKLCPCHHLYIRAGDQDCYIVFCTVKTKQLRYAYIQYISHRALFVRYTKQIRHTILKYSHSPIIVVDSRLVANINLPMSFLLPVKSYRLYKSSTLKPEQIDNLYSELVLLNLGTLPKLRSVVSDIREWWHTRRQTRSSTVGSRTS